MDKGGLRGCISCRGGIVVVVVVVVDAGMEVDGVRRLERRSRVARLCGEYDGIRMAVGHWEMLSLKAVLDRLVHPVETIILLRYAKALLFGLEDHLQIERKALLL